MRPGQIARGGVLTALSLALLLGASMFSVASWALCMLAGFLPALFILAGQRTTAVVMFSATAILGIILLPDKSVALLYATFFGLYTILKSWFEQCRRPLEWICKLTFFNLWIGLLLYLITLGFVPDVDHISVKLLLILFGTGNVIFVYYDLCSSKIFAGMRKLAQNLNSGNKG